MFQNHIYAFLLLTLCSCTWNQQPDSGSPSTRDEAVGIVSTIHSGVRDTERGIYNLLYGLRDGVDSFVYDAQKDYYQDYQK